MKTLNHLNLVVSDVEKSTLFYEGLFGMERAWGEGDFVFLHCGDFDLALRGGEPQVHPKFHFGFRVDSKAEVEAWQKKLQDEEIEISHGPEDYGDYVTFTCRDPDGYGIEIYFEPGPRGRTGAVDD